MRALIVLFLSCVMGCAASKPKPASANPPQSEEGTGVAMDVPDSCRALFFRLRGIQYGYGANHSHGVLHPSNRVFSWPAGIDSLRAVVQSPCFIGTPRETVLAIMGLPSNVKATDEFLHYLIAESHYKAQKGIFTYGWAIYLSNGKVDSSRFYKEEFLEQ